MTIVDECRLSLMLILMQPKAGWRLTESIRSIRGMPVHELARRGLIEVNLVAGVVNVTEAGFKLINERN